MDLARPRALARHSPYDEVEFAFLEPGQEVLGRASSEVRRRSSFRGDGFDRTTLKVDRFDTAAILRRQGFERFLNG